MIELPREYKRFLVTGGAGFIGSHICEELLGQGREVICIDNLMAGKQENVQEFFNNPNFKFIKQDAGHLWTDISKAGLISGVDIVFHQAASKCTVCRDNPFRDLFVNAWEAHCVFAASIREGVKKVIHASTGSVFGGKPKSFYGVSKLAGESYLRAFKDYYPDFRYTALRYHHVYGTRQDNDDKGGVIPIFIRRIDEGLPVIIHGDGSQIRHFTYVKDVIGANFLVASNSDTDEGFYDVVSDIQISILDLAILLHRLMGKEEVRLIFADRRPGDIASFDIDGSKLEALGFKLGIGFHEGLQKVIGWYLSQREES